MLKKTVVALSLATIAGSAAALPAAAECGLHQTSQTSALQAAACNPCAVTASPYTPLDPNAAADPSAATNPSTAANPSAAANPSKPKS